MRKRKNVFTTEQIVREAKDPANLVYPREVCRTYPSSQTGKPRSIAWFYRVCWDGSPGPNGDRVRLEAVWVAGSLATTRGALERWIEALNPVTADEAHQPAPPRSPAKRARAAEQACEELQRLGA